MEPFDRPRIVPILYNEVIRATQADSETKFNNPRAHRTAREALEKAVARYTEFALKGNIPQDLMFSTASRILNPAGAPSATRSMGA